MNRRERRAQSRVERGGHGPSDASVIAAGPLVRAAVERAEEAGADRSELLAMIVRPSAVTTPQIAAIVAVLAAGSRTTTDGSHVFVVPRDQVLAPLSDLDPQLVALLPEIDRETGDVTVVLASRGELYLTRLGWTAAEDLTDQQRVMALLASWPETAHLAQRVAAAAMPFRTKANTIESGYPLHAVVPIFEEFIAITDTLSAAPAHMRAVADNLRDALPGLRAQLARERKTAGRPN